ncbi:MAG: CaiB/BaiF CoA transferase family protein [Dehalococcoidia bacterium]
MTALEGITILDLSYQGPGPFCTAILGDLGASVTRVSPPPTAGARQATREADRRQAAYSASNRNKKSILLNLKSEEGRSIFHRLAEKADVVVEGFRPGVARRLGIDYETISAINPRIVYCSVTGYGQDGPYARLPGHDVNYISFAGVLDLIGERDGSPIIPLNLVADYGAGGMSAAIGILSAIIALGRTGRGQYIDISLTDTTISLLTQILLDRYFSTGNAPGRGEHMLSGAHPCYSIYRTKDGGYMSLGCLEPWLWENLCREIGREDFIPYNMTRTPDASEETKWQEMRDYLGELFLTETRDEWFERMKDKNIPIGKVLSLKEVFADPQVLHRRMVMELEHPEEGKVKQVGIGIKLSDTPGAFRDFASPVGRDTDETLKRLGYSVEKIEELRRDGVI